ncbi:DUF2269 family protein [Streptomyces sp. ICBB 8177]|uniref:DUF2269 family protein n=1 Tax=Streptomyces sp. ICBB 8177 TaxID=563922 RepID=UPI000D682A18|nr:DUF2269 family protein [Streptomyces sp. ICBB 8177]PWI44113.1 hypothetical protein CK485_19005 [Streptomyces sp. ICBB 8177]
MTRFVLVLHVLAAIVAIGPVTVAASMFPTAVRRAASAPGEETLAGVRVLNRICRVYAQAGLAVPVFGFATAGLMHVLGSPWLIASILLTTVAALVLGLLVLPRQHSLLASLAEPEREPRLDRTATARLAMLTGVFNLLWATVTVLMIVRPGSTTGA